MKTILIIAVMLIGMMASAQTLSFEPVTATAIEAQQIKINIGDKTFDVTISSGGAYSIERISKSGNAYKQYLGYDTGYAYDDKMVFTDSNKQKYWYLGLSKTGYPKKLYLSAK